MINYWVMSTVGKLVPVLKAHFLEAGAVFAVLEEGKVFAVPCSYNCLTARCTLILFDFVFVITNFDTDKS